MSRRDKRASETLTPADLIATLPDPALFVAPPVTSARFALSVALPDPTLGLKLMQRPAVYASEGYAIVEATRGLRITGHGVDVLVPWPNVREVSYTPEAPR